MSRFVRSSKYRHVFADSPKKEYCYENVKVTGSAWDTNLLSASAHYIAVNWQVSGGGAFGILPLLSPSKGAVIPNSSGGGSFPSKLPDILPLARGHTGPVLDTAFSPHSDSLVASAAEDGKILLWNIKPEIFEGWGEDGWECPPDWEYEGKLTAGGGRKVGQIEFNPVAQGLLASASGDHCVRLWDIKHESEAKLTLKGHKDAIQSLAWNAHGTLLATTARDRKIRLFDPRAGAEAVRTADGHGGIKGSRVLFMGNKDRLVSTGFSKMSDRQVMIWELGSLNSLVTESIDSSSGVLMPFYAEGNDILFLAGKGDGNVRYYEYADDELHYLSEYKSVEPQRGMCFLPRRGLDVGSNEIARAFKLTTDKVEPLSFIVPRKAENFQADIFPPALSSEPALSASEWFDGKNAAPKLVDLESGQAATNDSVAPTVKSTPTKSETPASASTPSEASKSTATPASTLNERSGSLPSLRDMEIKQDDPDSDEEITEAKKRAPADDDDDDFGDKPKSASPVSRELSKPTSGSAQDEKDVKPVVTEMASVTNPSEDVKSPQQDNGELESLRTEIADLKRKLEASETRANKLQSQLDRARALGKELAGL